MVEERDDEGFVPFEQIKFLDAPSIALTNLLESESGFDSVRRTFLQPESLSPREREGYVQRLKKKVGAESGVAGAAMDIALNPFTWLLFLTGPAALKKGGTRLIGKTATPGGAFGKFVNLYRGVLSHLGMLGGLQAGSGTAAQAGVIAANKSFERMLQKEHEILGKARYEFARWVERETGAKLGHTLAWQEVSDPRARQLLREYQTATSLIAHGYDSAPGTRMNVSTVTARPTVILKGPDGQILHARITDDLLPGLRKVINHLGAMKAQKNVGGGKPLKAPEWEGMEVVEVVAQNKKELREIEKYLGETSKTLSRDQWPLQSFKETTEIPSISEGRAAEYLKNMSPEAQRYFEAQREYLDWAKRHLFGTEAARNGGKFEVDPERVYKVYEHMMGERAFRDKHGIFDNWAADAQSEMEMWVHPEMRRLIKDGHIEPEDFLAYMKSSLEHSLDTPTYMPRNNKSVYGLRGDDMRRRTVDEWRQEARPQGARPFNSVIQESSRDVMLDPEDLAFAESMFGETQGSRLMKQRIETARDAAHQRGDLEMLFTPLTTEENLRKYHRNLMTTDAMVLDELTPIEMEEWRAMESREPEPFRDSPHRAPWRGPAMNTAAPVWVQDILPKSKPVGGWSRTDFMKAQFAHMDPRDAAVWEDLVWPRILGQRKVSHMLTWHSMRWAQDMTKSLAQTPFMKGMGKQAKWFEDLRQNMENWGTNPLPIEAASKFSGDLAGYGYSVFLTNPMSVMGNMLQPFAAGAALGYDNVFKGYARAIKQMGGYIAERIKHPMRLDRATHHELIKRHFRHPEELGLLDDIVHAESMSMSQPYTEPGKLKFWTQVFPLKFFGLSDRFNKVATGEAMLAKHAQEARRTGLRMSPEREVLESARAASDFQFLGSAESIPTMFGGTTDPHSFWGRVLNNPFVRMFWSFPMRSATQWLVGSQQYGSGVRPFGLQRLGGPSTEIPGVIGDTLRMLGAAAVIYEGGKNLVGADLSKWTGIDAAVSGIDPRTYVGTPIFSMPVDIVKNLMEGDGGGLMRETVPKLFPGGILVQKMLGATPLNTPINKTYADWNNPRPDGTIPVFKHDGSLISFEQPVPLLMRGLGADLGMWKDDQELITHLAKNATEIKDYRRRHTRARLMGSFHEASALEQEFRSRYGFPLVTTQAQLNAALQLEKIPVAQRMINQFPRDARPTYQRYFPSPPSGSEGPRPDEGLGGRSDEPMEQGAFQSYGGFTGGYVRQR